MFTLIARRDYENATVGNAILYGGEYSKHIPGMFVFFVETDFGNHMRLTESEIHRMFTRGKLMDYAQWRRERQELHAEPTLLVQQGIELEAAIEDMLGGKIL